MRLVPRLILLAVVLAALAPDGKEPAKLRLSKEEQNILDMTNKERAREKLAPLETNGLLFQAARAHSANMLKQGKMEHVLDGKAPAQRVEAAGYDYKRVGENIAWSDAPIPAEKIMKGWMDSEPHRKNILNPDFTEIGVGVARNDQGETYYTQVFATPRGQ